MAHIISEDGWTLVHKDDKRPVTVGESVTDFRGEDAIITGGRSPHKAGSVGKVWTEAGEEFYPAVFFLEWRRPLEG